MVIVQKGSSERRSWESDGIFGRDEELNLLTAQLEQARRGRGGGVILLGDAGMGKTRLAEALAADAARTGFSVAWGRCPNAEAPPYWPWKQILGTLLGSDDVLLSHLGDTGQRTALFASVVEGLERALAEFPALVLLEDIHWADPSSLALLQFLAALLPGMPLLLVVTSRDDPSELTEEQSRVLHELPPAISRVVLGGIDRAATGALVEAITGKNVPVGMVQEVLERTAGNPFFISEVARMQQSRAGVQGFAVPLGVFQVLSRKLSRLSPPAAELLAAAAVHGEPELSLLARLSGTTEEQVGEVLAEVAGLRLLIHSEGRYTFEHALVRETVYNSQKPEGLARLHRRIAEDLQDHRAPAGSLATHWGKAHGADARQKAAAFAFRAACDSVSSLAYEQAICYYRWGLDWGYPDKAQLLLELGEAQLLAGELTPGRETLFEAASLGLEQNRPDLVGKAVLAMGGGVAGFEVDVSDERLENLTRRALEGLGDEDSALRAALLARLSLVLTRFGQEQDRVRLTSDAVAMARRVDDLQVLVAALSAQCDALAGPDHSTRRLEIATEMVQLAQDARYPELILVARRLLLIALLELGELALVDAEIASYALVAERLRLPLYTWQIPIWKGMRASVSGDLDRTLDFAGEADDLAHKAGSANAKMMVCSLRMDVARKLKSDELKERAILDASAIVGERQRDITGAMETMIAHQDLYGGPGTVCFAIIYLAEAGELVRARRHLHSLMARGTGGIPKDSEFLEFIWFLADAAILLNEPDAAREAASLLAPYAAVWAVDGHGGACFGMVAHQLWRLESYLGNPRAEEWRVMAANRYRQVGAHYLAEQLGLQAQKRAVPNETGEFLHEGATWVVSYAGRRATVLHSKGMNDLASLMAGPGREWHVLDLIEASGGPPAKSAGGDAGPALDSAARDAYRRRIADLEGELAEAESDNDTGRAAALREERDLILVELGAALGLGGRTRVIGDPVERARKAVTMRISTALKAISSVHPELGSHLRSSVVTGRFCSYRPERPTAWEV